MPVGDNLGDGRVALVVVGNSTLRPHRPAARAGRGHCGAPARTYRWCSTRGHGRHAVAHTRGTRDGRRGSSKQVLRRLVSTSTVRQPRVPPLRQQSSAPPCGWSSSFPASITSVVDTPRLGNSDADPSRVRGHPALDVGHLSCGRAPQPDHLRRQRHHAVVWLRTRGGAQRPESARDAVLHEPHVVHVTLRVRLAAADGEEDLVAVGRIGKCRSSAAHSRRWAASPP